MNGDEIKAYAIELNNDPLRTLHSRSKGDKRLVELAVFAKLLKQMQPDFQMSSRGWGYFLEGMNVITKAEFDRVQGIINDCRKLGFLPIDFTAQDTPRQFKNLYFHTPDVYEYLVDAIDSLVECPEKWQPDISCDEEVYIQVLVEKVDLVTLFGPLCNLFRIPIATAKGWSDIYQRGEMALRYKMAEEIGRSPVLLYCGDHDPMGVLISDTLRKNFWDLHNGHFKDEEPWTPSNLKIDRFGLNYDFIEENNLTWIDNLITGSGQNLANPAHPHHYHDYVQNYISEYGERKCEANAIVRNPDSARQLFINAVEKYLGEGAFSDYKERIENDRAYARRILKEQDGVLDTLHKAKNNLNDSSLR